MSELIHEVEHVADDIWDELPGEIKYGPLVDDDADTYPDWLWKIATHVTQNAARRRSAEAPTDMPDDGYRDKVIEALRGEVKEGLTVAVFERLLCAVCVDCGAILHALPSEVPAPSCAIYEHKCSAAEQPTEDAS